MLDVLILGAGISGLSTAWKLKLENPAIKLKVLERTNRVGGSIYSLKSSSGQLYEMGPRSFRDEPKMRALLSSLSLDDQIITASKETHRRYLLLNDRCVSLFSLGGWFFFKALYRDIFCSKGAVEDESVYEFFSKRYGEEFASLFADSLVTGVYAADSKTLSMQCAFPALWKSGSLFKSFWKNRLQLLTLKSGLSTLPEALYERLKNEVQLETDVGEITDVGRVETSRGLLQARKVISTLPRPDLLPYTNVTIVSCGFDKPNLLPQGFGMLVPTVSHKELLGVVFDSSVFPQQTTSMPSRCTFMFGGARCPSFSANSDEEIMQKVESALARYFNVQEPVAEFNIWRADGAIPAFPVGFAQVREWMQKDQVITHSGSWMSGVALADCISI